MATKSEVFPDLHHKMSKKIAQLTKVIYHLNTRNEDHQSEVDSLNNFHQNEIQQILRDSTNKINKLKEQLESRQIQVDLEVKLEKLNRKHEEEKANAMKELQSIKAKYEARETKLVKDFQSKFDNFNNEIESINRNFNEKIDKFESTNKELKSALDIANQSGSIGLKELKEKHEKELAEIAGKNDEKYQAMLSEQVKAQDLIRQDLIRKVEEAKLSVQSLMQKEMEQTVGQLRAQLIGDKQEALLLLRHEYDDKLKLQLEESNAKLELVSGEIKRKTDEFGVLLLEKVKEAEEYEKKIEDLKQQLNNSIGDGASKVNGLIDEIAQYKSESSALKAKILERDEEISRFSKLLDQNAKKTADLQLEIQALKDSIVRMQKELAEAGGATAAVEADLRQKLASSVSEETRLKSLISSLNNDLAKIKDHFEAFRNESKANDESNVNKINSLNQEKLALESKIDQMLSASKNSMEQSSLELSDLRQQLVSKEKEFISQKLNLEENFRKQLNDLSASSDSKNEMLLTKVKSLEEQNKLELLKYEDELKNRRQEFESELFDLKTKHKETLDTLKLEHSQQVDGLKTTIAGLESQLDEVSKASDGEKGLLKAEMSKLESKATSLQKELEARKKESERSESVCTSLKNQVESLREELKSSQLAFREKMESSKAKLEADWQAKLDALVETQSKLQNEALDELKRIHFEELTVLKKSHADEILSLKGALQKEASQASSDLAIAEQERLRLLNELSSEKQERNQEVTDLKSKFIEETKLINDQHKREIDTLRKELSGTADSKEKKLKDDHASEIAALENSHKAALLELSSKLNIEHDCKMSAQNQLFIDEKISLVEKYNEINKSNINSLKEENSVHIRELSQKHDEITDKLQTELNNLKTQLSSFQMQVVSLEESLSRAKADKITSEEQHSLEKDQIVRDNQLKLRKEQEACQKSIFENQERSLNDMNILKDEFNEQRRNFENEKQYLMRELSAINDKWNNRESRPEDLERIRELEIEMVDKDHLVKKTKDEMMYFKREMLNREENYNQKFGAAPNVGVMQVIKNKDSKKNSKPGR